ncbi:hypothetical protein CY34DRAFT_798044 [Suillus luteus UH-Slu-Lm8-n1]|uniref:Uncharacterized protein n=1 Tax=Suillus luteus UH-Slu-Lm8-n1 TaxID=930992 RepID=A0A0D0C110_9AGAM|nr:hypothetical protein CY34DRAFT_798044 [Suillus luteus UH-Slu-Lm8-n1]
MDRKGYSSHTVAVLRTNLNDRLGASAISASNGNRGTYAMRSADTDERPCVRRC